ncbi:MAG TPA: GNAT family N-acetyltransferase [Dongiaceae bacterium]
MPSHGRRVPLPRCAGQVALRRLAPKDLAAFQAYRRDPELGRYQGWTPMPDAEAQAFLAQMHAAVSLHPGVWFQLGIADGQSLQLIGDIGLLLSADGSSAEIGYTLARSAQGRGLATLAVREAVALVFECSAASQVLATTDARNRASIRLLERIGMQRAEESTALFRGEPCVEITYAIARPLG